MAGNNVYVRPATEANRELVRTNKILTDDPHTAVYIPTEHAYIHEGKAFIAGNLWGSGGQVANDANADILIQAGTGMHVIIIVAVSADFELRFYENVTFTGAGTSLTAFNKNRYSTRASLSTISHTPTGIDIGSATELPPAFIPGGTKDAGSGGVGGNFNREIDLKAGLDYLIRATNRSGGNATVNPIIEWYEPANDN